MTAASPVNAEVPVGREHLAMAREFRHPHQARIGQAHWEVCILADQTPEIGPLFLSGELHHELAAVDGLEDRVG